MIGGENIAVPSRHVAFRLVSSRLLDKSARAEPSRAEPSRGPVSSKRSREGLLVLARSADQEYKVRFVEAHSGR